MKLMVHMQITLLWIITSNISAFAYFQDLTKDMRTEILTHFFAANPIIEYENLKESCRLKRVSKEWQEYIDIAQQALLKKQEEFVRQSADKLSRQIVKNGSVLPLEYVQIIEALRHSCYLWLYKYFVNHPEKLNKWERFGTYIFCLPLNYAAEQGPECVDLLLRLGANANAKGHYGNTPLEAAIYCCPEECRSSIAGKLIKAGAELHYCRRDGSIFDARKSAQFFNDENLITVIE
jgi:hypothetical protein